VTEIPRKIASHLITQVMTNEKEAEARDDRNDYGHCHHQQNVRTNT
jgi:hypothetical protein